MSGPRVTIVNYTLSMMRGGGETRDLAFATHLRGARLRRHAGVGGSDARAGPPPD